MQNKERVIYPDIYIYIYIYIYLQLWYIPSAIRPVPHNDDITISIPPDNLDSSSESDDEHEINDDLSQEYIPHEN